MIFKKTFQLLIFLSPVFCFAQNATSTDNFIVYKFTREVDSLFVSKLDLFNQTTIDSSLVIDIFINDRIPDNYYDNDNPIYYSYRLVDIGNYKKIYKYYNDYFQYLAKNTNRFYVSYNKKYKIPVVFTNYDERFKYDDKGYFNKISFGMRFIYFAINQRQTSIIVDINREIPDNLKK